MQYPWAQKFTRKIAYIRRFITNFVGRYQPFSRLIKQDVTFVWISNATMPSRVIDTTF